MLLIDGVKYELWIPQDEIKEFHPIIEEHAKEIFGESSEYFDIKKRLESVTGKGSVPDGFVIVFGEQPCWHIVEIELSKHNLHDHIVNQISRFIVGINNPQTQRRIVNAINEDIDKHDCRRLKIKKDIEPREIRQFLDDVIDQKPILTIVIEERTSELDEVLKIFPQYEKKVIEFKTFTRQGIGLPVHAHLFEPLYSTVYPEPTQSKQTPSPVISSQGKRITVQDLINHGLISPGQRLFKAYKDKQYEAEIISEGKLKLLHDNTIWDSLSSAAQHIAGTPINGWVWWNTHINGKECPMDEIRKKLQE